MSAQYARAQAEQLLARLGAVTLPVDVRAVTRGLGLRLAEQQLGDVSGLLMTGNGHALVAVNSAHHEHRKRFSIAHEIGHFYLGHQFEAGAHVHVDKGNFISARGARAAAGIDPKEIEANQFAAALLMPSALLRAEVQKRTGGAPLFDSLVPDLAHAFEVSEQAMTIRLSTLGLL